MELNTFIVGSIEHLIQSVEDANAELKGRAKVKLPSSLTLQVGLNKDKGIIWNPMNDTAVAQLSCEIPFTPEIETPAMAALAETEKDRKTTEKKKGNK